MNIYNLIKKCEEQSRVGLEWFRDHNGETDVPYLAKMGDVQLISPARGIYKPADEIYARSVKQTLKMVYSDRDPFYFSDGSWLYVYHQRGNSTLDDRKRLSDNIALYNNCLDKVPVGVSIQTKSKPKAQYSIGIGLPIGWIDGFFIIYCANKKGYIDDNVLRKPIKELFDYTLATNN